jgi:hypothetical protein
MPRPTHQSRTPCAILSLSCAAATLILPTAAKADVSILGTSQQLINSINYGEGPYGELRREYQSDWEDLDILHTFAADPGLRPISTTTKYQSTLITGPITRGSVSMAHHVDPGFVPLRDPNEPSLSLWSRCDLSISFSSPEMTQVQIRAATRVDSPEAFYAACGIRIYPAGPRTAAQPPLFWVSGGPTPDGPILSSLDHTITLQPGAWDMFIYTNINDLAARRESLAFPSTINLDASFAIIPAPATLLPLAAIPFLTAARRRRPSGR